MRCALCGTTVNPKTSWKGTGDQFYCSEFCADAEAPEDGISAPAPSTLLDLHRNRPYERLERLLPYMRAYSGRAMATNARTESAQQVFNRVA